MTQFWPKGTELPITNTFGTRLDFSSELQIPHHSQLGDGHGGLRSLAILLLRQFASGHSERVIRGGRADSLLSVMERKHSKTGTSKPTWLQSVFGLKVGSPVDRLLEDEVCAVSVGPDLKGARFNVFLHDTPTSVRLAASAGKRNPLRSIGGATARALPVREYLRLADELEEGVEVKLSLLVQKQGRNPQVEVRVGAGASEHLPLQLGDIFELQIDMDPKAHTYVACIDSTGKELPLHPWLPTLGWDDPLANEFNDPRSRLTLLADVRARMAAKKSYLRAGKVPGAECLIIVVHRERLELAAVRKIFEGLHDGSPVTYRDPHRLEHIRVGRGVNFDPTDATKSIVLGAGPSPDTLDAICGRFGERLRSRVDHASMLVIPSRGGND